MGQFCLVVHILPGRTADARDPMRELETGRNADYQRAVWYQRRGSGLLPRVALRGAPAGRLPGSVRNQC